MIPPSAPEISHPHPLWDATPDAAAAPGDAGTGATRRIFGGPSGWGLSVKVSHIFRHAQMMKNTVDREQYIYIYFFLAFDGCFDGKTIQHMGMNGDFT